MSLSIGLNAGIGAATVAFLAIFLILGTNQALAFLAISYLPFLFLSYMILKMSTSGTALVFRYPLGLIVSRTALCVLFVSLVALFFLNQSGVDVRGIIHTFLDGIIPPEFKARKVDLIDQMVDIMPGFMFLSWILTVLTNAFVAQRILCKYQQQLRPFRLKDYTFDTYWDMIVAVGFLLLLLDRFFDLPILSLIGKTVILLGCLPLAAIGFRICQLQFSGGRFKGFGFSILILLTFLLVWPLLIIVMLGFIEPWYHLTQRVAEENQAD